MSDDDYPPISPLPVGLAGKCPRCGSGALFRGFLTLADKCDACGLEYKFADSGDGPAFFVMTLSGFIVIGAVLGVEVAWEPPVWVYPLFVLPLAFLCVALLRPLKGVLIALQYYNKAQEGRRWEG